MHNTDGRAASCIRLTNGLVSKESKWLLPSGRGVQRKIGRGVKPLAGWVAMCALLFSLCIPVQGGLLKADVDFSNYDVPLFDQIVSRIKAKVEARLGEGVNTQDRYFIVPFAYQRRWNNPQFSHSFISVIRVLGDGKQKEAFDLGGPMDARSTEFILLCARLCRRPKKNISNDLKRTSSIAGKGYSGILMNFLLLQKSKLRSWKR